MKNNNKIAIVSASLGVGGAERFGGLLSIMLDNLGYEVHNIIILDYVDYEYRGTLVNLGKLFSAENDIFRPVKKARHIADYLQKNDIQTIIDNRSRPTLLREVFTKWIYRNRKVYFMVHSSKMEVYLPKSVFWAKYLYRDAAKLICVSKAIEQRVQKDFKLQNTATIYNPIIATEMEFEKPAGIPDDFILFFGRLEEKIKNFNLLLNAFSASRIYEKNIKLLIIGDGPDKAFIESGIKKLNLQKHVQLLGFKKKVMPFVKHARFSVLTSHYEGFPMSVIESLAVGTPVVAVDCETGPREIIEHKSNGLLVPNHNEAALAEAFKIFIEDEKLYQSCKNNAQKSVEHLSLTSIAQQWQQLLA